MITIYTRIPGNIIQGVIDPVIPISWNSVFNLDCMIVRNLHTFLGNNHRCQYWIHSFRVEINGIQNRSQARYIELGTIKIICIIIIFIPSGVIFINQIWRGRTRVRCFRIDFYS